MKIINITLLLLLGCLFAGPVEAQSGRIMDEPAARSEKRSAQSLFVEVSDFVTRKYEEFDQKKVAYDAKLVVAIQEQQRELAGKYSQWIDIQPTILNSLRGQVVLLDFWAHWCGPCRYTFPKLQKWHESYNDKGLVILGLTKYYGHAEGKSLGPREELEYLREFKKQNRLPYGFVVSESSANDVNYGVFSIPMSFLIDRSGNLRFIAAGAGEEEIARLGTMLKKLLAEPYNQSDKGEVLRTK